jgi:iron(III) transport system permease protein
VLWVTPGPLLGLGLKETIHALLSLEEAILPSDFAPLRAMLYDQPSPLPGGWASMLRFLPLALAMIWPTLHAIPRELTEQATLDGASVWWWVGWPHLRSAATAAAIVVSVLSLGEVSASKLVTPPHLRMYIFELFNQMHYGPEASVAAMALVQLAITAVGVLMLTRESAFGMLGRSQRGW